VPINHQYPEARSSQDFGLPAMRLGDFSQWIGQHRGRSVFLQIKYPMQEVPWKKGSGL
jgi:hypothetical protein